MSSNPDGQLTFWTVGHSSRPYDEFEELLRSAAITLVADVRRYPGSRKFPRYGADNLAASLEAAGIEYRHFPELGGRRKASIDSRHTAWRNESFRAYADYMDTEEFTRGIGRLLELAHEERLAIMCSEAVWWRCHRGLIADYLKVRGHRVIHLLSPTRRDEHPYTSAATVVDGHLDYSGDGERSDSPLD
ncbi:MAG TPA: DUF488 domain-containing protein [Trueperaceae bacterium]